MIIREKGGEYRAGDVSTLLDFLGVRKEAAEIQSNRRLAVSGDVELIATVPFVSEQLKENNEPLKKGIAWTLSTFDLDRFGERVDPAGWEFSHFSKNPVVQWAHRFDVPAIGKIEGLAVDGEGLHGVVVFNDKAFDPFGWSIGQRVKAGVIRAGSVGFRVLEIEIPSKADSRDGASLIFRKQELLEFSICNVPANPFALAKMSANQRFGEELGMGNESGVNAVPFWGGLINNFIGE